MDQELKQYLDGKFTDVDAKFTEVAARFTEVAAKFTEVAAKLTEVAAKFGEMHAIFATKQDLERVETALLTEFHKWASPAEMRARTHAAALRAIDLEMESLTERVQKLENR